LQWLTTHEPSTEHDLSGLRDNFNPRARWKAAIAGARALHRFGSSGSRSSTTSKSSGGWKTTAPDTDSDDDDDEVHLDQESAPNNAADGQLDNGPGHNDFVKVTPPEEYPQQERQAKDAADKFAANDTTIAEASTSAKKPADAHELKREHDAPHEPLEKEIPKELHEVQKEPVRAQHNNHHSGHHDSEDEELMMPGSFNTKPQHGHGHHGFADLLRKMHIKSD
jgi:calcium/calmodulin-dependent protein kinase I